MLQRCVVVMGRGRLVSRRRVHHHHRRRHRGSPAWAGGGRYLACSSVLLGRWGGGEGGVEYGRGYVGSVGLPMAGGSVCAGSSMYAWDGACRRAERWKAGLKRAEAVMGLRA